MDQERHSSPGVRGLWQRYRHHKGVLLVAAVGNYDMRRPLWPAALPQVVSVGALAAEWRSRASFSDPCDSAVRIAAAGRRSGASIGIIAGGADAWVRFCSWRATIDKCPGASAHGGFPMWA